MCYVRTTSTGPAALGLAAAASATTNSGGANSNVAALLSAAVAQVQNNQAKQASQLPLLQPPSSTTATTTATSAAAAQASLVDQLLMDSFAFDDNSWLNSSSSNADFSLFGEDASVLAQSDSFLPWLQSSQILPPAPVTTAQPQQLQIQQQQQQLLHQQQAILNSIQSSMPPLSSTFPLSTISSSATLVSPLMTSPGDETDTASSSASVSPAFQIVGGVKPEFGGIAGKKRGIECVEKPCVPRKGKKSIKVDSLETKCAALERENETLNMKLAVLENGSKFFAQREKELMDRVKNLESQLSESHRAMLRQMSS